MAGLDLTALEGVFTPWLVDQVEILRDNQYVGDDVDDDGDVTVPEPTVIYNGVGMLQPLNHAAVAANAMASAVAAGATYRVLLPADAVFATDPRPGDSVRVTAVNGASQDLRQMVHQFRLVDYEQVSGWNILRFLYVKQVNVATADQRSPWMVP